MARKFVRQGQFGQASRFVQIYYWECLYHRDTAIVDCDRRTVAIGGSDAPHAQRRSPKKRAVSPLRIVSVPDGYSTGVDGFSSSATASVQSSQRILGPIYGLRSAGSGRDRLACDFVRAIDAKSPRVF